MNSQKPLITKLETRYVVFKLSDVQKMPLNEQLQLSELWENAQEIRIVRGAQNIDGIVIERDWPEYDLIKALLLNRINGIKFIPDQSGRPMAYIDPETGAICTAHHDRFHPLYYDRDAIELLRETLAALEKWPQGYHHYETIHAWLTAHIAPAIVKIRQYFKER